jgi:hypothetical protein
MSDDDSDNSVSGHYKSRRHYLDDSHSGKYRMTLCVWQQLPKQRDELLYNCSEFDRQNDEWVNFPIGMSWQFTNFPEPINNAFLGPHNNLVLCAIKDHTDQRRRGGAPICRTNILQTLANNGIQNVDMDSTTYFKALPTYKFVISPEGNGIDCHRHYEALMAGCIPIVEDRDNIRNKYSGCPILFTRTYYEITPDYLNKKYEEMYTQLYNFTNLHFSSFDHTVQRQIRDNGNYWGMRVANKAWYPPSSVCAVFVCNKPYFDKFLYTCKQLVTNGNYKGPICLVIGDDLQNDPLLEHPWIQSHAIQIKHFPTRQFSKEFLYIQSKMDRASHWSQKLFQYHKFNLFDTYFTQYDYIFYLDCGITIFSDVQPILDERKLNKLLAHSDAYPSYENKLEFQFEKNNVFWTDLSTKYNINIDYFQTTMMLYDTHLIDVEWTKTGQLKTSDKLFNLLETYPISITNDQGIIALYFTTIKPAFEQLRIQNDTHYFYDYISRHRHNNYIMLKSLEQTLWT